MSKTDRILRYAIGLLMCTFVYVIFVALHERIIEVGDAAPDFSVTADNGRTVSLNSFGGKVLVLNFWATWCATCMEELPSLDQFQRDFASAGVVVLGVSVDKDEKAYKRFLSRVNVAFLTTRDPENKINAEYGTFKFPETYIISRDGKVLSKIISATNWTDDKMMTYVKSLL
jgi:peroxiredoxin